MLLTRIPYRPVALVLGLFFILFTAGLPVALTFCPMDRSLGDVCPLCKEAHERGPAKTAAVDNVPCCTTVSSESPNAEFLHARTVLESMQKSPLVLLTPVVIERSTDRPVAYISAPEVLLTRSDDIPIITSSLLI